MEDKTAKLVEAAFRAESWISTLNAIPGVPDTSGIRNVLREAIGEFRGIDPELISDGKPDYTRKPSSRFYLNIIEAERGWGRKIEAQRFFDEKDKAAEYAKEFNSKLPDGPAPDWYMQAEGPYPV